jgi:hypothetical protein
VRQHQTRSVAVTQAPAPSASDRRLIGYPKWVFVAEGRVVLPATPEAVRALVDLPHDVAGQMLCLAALNAREPDLPLDDLLALVVGRGGEPEPGALKRARRWFEGFAAENAR